MKKTESETYVLDTSAILTLWNDEDGAEVVEQILRQKAKIYVSFMSVMEGRYRLWKNIGKGESDEFSEYLSLLPVERINLTDLIFEKAIEIKAKKNLSLADSWIAATAIATNSILVHKDPEFEGIKDMVKLKMLPYKLRK